MRCALRCGPRLLLPSLAAARPLAAAGRCAVARAMTTAPAAAGGGPPAAPPLHAAANGANGHSAPPPLPPPLLSVAPMMDWTDVHFRQLARLISRRTWLYTEMVVDKTLIHNPDTDRFLAFPPEQRPLVLQLGGSDPEALAAACRIAARYGYDEVNLNCGCPSDRVAGAGCFGAALMLRPQLVARCCAAAAAALPAGTPVTVKCRLGVDDADSYAELAAFVAAVAAGSPVRHFLVHARKCVLRGLSPAQNRSVPPLRYGWVLALRRDFPGLRFTLNGGVASLAEAAAALALPAPGGGGAAALAGVMVGRAAYHAPWDVLGDADVGLHGAPENGARSRRQVLAAYRAYADGVLAAAAAARAAAAAAGAPPPRGGGGPGVRALFAPLLGLFHGEPRGKRWRAAVDGALRGAATVGEVLDATLPVLLDETLDAPPRPLAAARAAGLPALAHLDPELPPPAAVGGVVAAAPS